MDSSKIEVKKDVINEAIELFNVLRKNRKKSVNDVKDSFDVQNDMERGNLLGGIVNWSDAARSHTALFLQICFTGKLFTYLSSN